MGAEFAVGVVPGGVTGTGTAGVADGVLRWVGVAVPLDQILIVCQICIYMFVCMRIYTYIHEATACLVVYSWCEISITYEKHAGRILSMVYR